VRTAPLSLSLSLSRCVYVYYYFLIKKIIKIQNNQPDIFSVSRSVEDSSKKPKIGDGNSGIDVTS